jgi:DNA-binding PadR family transcriptional regulator
MSLPHALLGLINYEPATGYDLKMRFGESIHFFWNATLPQIYRTLKQMGKQGWVEFVTEHQSGKPSRKIYRITAAGKEELTRWLAQPLETVESRLPILVKVFFGNQMRREDFAAQVMHWRSLHAAALEQYQEVGASLAHHSGEPVVSTEGPFWAMTLDFGVRHSRAMVEWCDKILEYVKKEGGTASGDSPEGVGDGSLSSRAE